MFAKEIYFISVFAISNIHHSIKWGVGKEQGERGRVRGGREKGRGKREEKKRYPDQGSEREKNKYLDLELQLAGWIRIRNTVRINFKASSFGLCAGGLAEPQGFGSFLQNLFRPVANIFSPLRQIDSIYLLLSLLFIYFIYLLYNGNTMAILQPLDSQYCSCVDHTIKEKKNCSCCYNAFYHSNALNR